MCSNYNYRYCSKCYRLYNLFLQARSRKLDCIRNMKSIYDLCAYNENACKSSCVIPPSRDFVRDTRNRHSSSYRRAFEIRLRQPTNDCKNDGSRLPKPPGSRVRQLLHSSSCRYCGKVKVVTFANLCMKVSGRAPDESQLVDRLYQDEQNGEEREREMLRRVTLP